jgi:hypothetical protein
VRSNDGSRPARARTRPRTSSIPATIPTRASPDGERPDDLPPELGRWQTVDLCLVASADDAAETLLDPDGPLLQVLSAQADDLWRSEHSATADALEAVASLIRDGDKALAKRLRRSATKARSRT